MLIINKSIINKRKQSAELLIENSMPPLPKSLQQLACELRPQKRPRKRLHIEDKLLEIEHDSSINIQVFNENLMKTENLYNSLVQRSRTDLDRILSKNSLADELIKCVYKFVKSIIKTSSKVQELKSYNEAINNLVHENRWQEVIDEKF